MTQRYLRFLRNPDGSVDVVDGNTHQTVVIVTKNGVLGDNETIKVLNSMKSQHESLQDFVQRSAGGR